MEDQAARLRRLVGRQKMQGIPLREEGGGARVIAITSGKGGVGKTSLTVNLALALQAEGVKTLIVDADLGMANVGVLLGASPRCSLLGLLEEDMNLQDVLLEGPFGLRYISGGSGMEEARHLTESERGLLMGKLVGCGELADVILVDTGAGLGDNVLDFILAADETLLITTPEPTALTDAYAVMKAYSLRAAQKNMKLIVNRVLDAEEATEVATKLLKTAERFLKMRVEALGHIYDDRQVARAVRRQRPLLVAYPSSAAAKCIRSIGTSLLHGKKVPVKRGWRTFLRYFLDFS